VAEGSEADADGRSDLQTVGCDAGEELAGVQSEVDMEPATMSDADDDFAHGSGLVV
jgi:hypothetical protein